TCLSGFQLSFDLLQKVGLDIVAFFQSKIPVPGNPKKVYRYDVDIPKELLDMCPDHFFDGHEYDSVVSLYFVKPGKVLWDLDKRHLFEILLLIGAFGHYAEDEELIHQDRESMVAVIYHGRKHGVYGLLEIVLDFLLLRGG